MPDANINFLYLPICIYLFVLFLNITIYLVVHLYIFSHSCILYGTYNTNILHTI